jgi:hypothetical protein
MILNLFYGQKIGYSGLPELLAGISRPCSPLATTQFYIPRNGRRLTAGYETLEWIEFGQRCFEYE